MYVKKPLNLCGEPNHLVVFYFLNKTKRNILKKHVPIFSLRNKWSKTNSPVFLVCFFKVCCPMIVSFKSMCFMLDLLLNTHSHCNIFVSLMACSNTKSQGAWCSFYAAFELPTYPVCYHQTFLWQADNEKRPRLSLITDGLEWNSFLLHVLENDTSNIIVL